MKSSIEERYGSKSDVTRYVWDHRGVRRLPSRGENGWVNAINRFIKVTINPDSVQYGYMYENSNTNSVSLQILDNLIVGL